MTYYKLVDTEGVAARLWGLSAQLLHAPDPDGLGPLDATVLVDEPALGAFRELTDAYLARLADLGIAARLRQRQRDRGEDGMPLVRAAVLVGLDDAGARETPVSAGS